MQELHRKYGNPQLVAQSCSAKLLSLPSVKDNYSNALRKFSSTVRGVVATLKHGAYATQLACYTTLQQLVTKLPDNLRRGWGKWSYSLEPKLPTLVDFDEWLDKTYMEESRAQPFDPRSLVKPKSSDRPTVMATSQDTTTEENSKATRKCLTCNGSHFLDRCNRFLEMTLE